MHPIFSVIQETLRIAGVPSRLATGRIRFVVLGPQPERWVAELDHAQCRLGEDRAEQPAELTVFCDAHQLEQMLTTGSSTRPLRMDGNDALLDSLAAVMTQAKSLIDARIQARGSDR